VIKKFYIVLGSALILFSLLVIGCSSISTPDLSAPFVDVTESVGLQFEHQNGMAGDFFLPEIVGSGVAWIDFDNDQDPDLYLVQSGESVIGGGPRSDRIYRNDDGRFVDVTSSMAAPMDGYGMGVAVGDFDNDGWDDLYVTQLGPNRLLKNDRGLRFVDVTEGSGTGDPWWSVSATFVDYDRDGWLDLFVSDYLDWSEATNQDCFRTNGLEDYCGPASYLPMPDRLFRNLGDGKFVDVTASAGIAKAYGAGLGVVAADFNRDGWPDIYVANDGLPNQLWMNLGDGRFEEQALMAGCAINADGKAEASMGIDVADFDADGDEDIFMAHLNEETNTLYVNDGRAGFIDQSASSGVGPASEPFTGFGAGWIDYDNDSQLDLYIVNGAVRTLEDQARAGDTYPLRQPNQLFRQVEGKFEEVPAGLGSSVEVSRGSATADYDNDGDLDLAIVNSAGRFQLLRNEVGAANRWVGFRVRGGPSIPREMIGAVVELEMMSGKRYFRRVRRDGSYASSNDSGVLFGLGSNGSVKSVTVRWPDGEDSSWDALEINRWHTLEP
jgi:hypothetical protein